ncbi:acid-sensing ion channel 1-like [Brachionus plicatilis]|uniref:Acid-sensing ion channel 1-like n=1 Tax=Brachionus plicatilis TaxID=10195 RepID=A0A3M7R2Y0_BRAPC|nr:acid-sensing ion channel 1-like [Brachionus plicatilis]
MSVSSKMKENSNCPKQSECPSYDRTGELKKKIRECILDWCENTTNHGFSNIVKADTILLRLFWVVILVLFSTYCFSNIVISITKFLAHEVVVSNQFVSESTAEYPSVTFCNLNPFDVASEPTTGEYLIEKLNQNSIMPVITTTNGTFSYELVNEAANLLKAIASSDKNLTPEQLEKLGFTINTMLISCYFDHVQCNTSAFSWFHDSQYGNCYTFNSLFDSSGQRKPSLISSKTGPTHGLNLEIFTGASGIHDYYTINKGIKVAIHQRGIRPLMEYEGVYIGTGNAAYIGFTRNNYSKLPYPFNDCKKNSEKATAGDSLYFNYTLQLSRYSQRLCFEICMQYEKIIPKCGCADPRTPIVDEKQEICRDKMSLNCTQHQIDLLDRQDIGKLCDAYCPDECDSLTYTKTVSSAYYPSVYYSNILQTQPNLVKKFNPENVFTPEEINDDSSEESDETDAKNLLPTQQILEKIPTKEEIRESVLMISVYYDDLKYLYVSESQAITFETLMGVIENPD